MADLMAISPLSQVLLDVLLEAMAGGCAGGGDRGRQQFPGNREEQQDAAFSAWDPATRNSMAEAIDVLLLDPEVVNNPATAACARSATGTPAGATSPVAGRL